MTKRCIPSILLRRSGRLKEALDATAASSSLVGVKTTNDEQTRESAKSKKSTNPDGHLQSPNKLAERKRAKLASDELLPAIPAIKKEQNDQDSKQQQQPASSLAPAFVANYEDLCIKPDGFILVAADELDLERSLMGGQSFRWTKLEAPRVSENIGPIFRGVVLNHALQVWRPSEDRIAFRRLNKESQKLEISESKALLEDYFRLNYKLSDLYEQWSARDKHLANCCLQYKGFRILRQDPVENLFSFICATNNNIKRISQMIGKLCTKYGSPLENGDDNIPTDREEPSTECRPPYRSFPTVERLAGDDVFHVLRHEFGFGYRAKFITETAKQLLELTEASGHKSARDYLFSLRKLPYKETCKQLMQFQGIGRKVADCICLMSMDHLNAVPIDCHIYEIVCRHYMPNLKRERKSLTDAVHDLISGHFNDLHGPLAGWSTSVLFVAELKHLNSSAPNKQSKQAKQAKVGASFKKAKPSERSAGSSKALA